MQMIIYKLLFDESKKEFCGNAGNGIGKEIELAVLAGGPDPSSNLRLRLLMQNPGRVFRPDAIYRAVWREEPYGAESTVAVHIRHLREKLEIDPAEPRYIKAVWGQGYKISS